MSMLSEPKILFLDDPTVGMDIQSRHIMWLTLEKLKRKLGITIFLTTHYLEEADHLSDTICFMANVKKLLQGSPASLRQYTQNDVIRVTTKTDDNAEELERHLQGYQFIQCSYCKGTAVYLQISEKEKSMQKIGALALKHSACVGIEIVEPTLEDIFNRL